MANFIYDKTTLETFIKNQGQLFDEPVAETLEDADEFLDMMLAVVVDSKSEVADYFEEQGADVEDDVLEASEVFALPDGRYLIVEG